MEKKKWWKSILTDTKKSGKERNLYNLVHVGRWSSRNSCAMVAVLRWSRRSPFLFPADRGYVGEESALLATKLWECCLGSKQMWIPVKMAGVGVVEPAVDIVVRWLLEVTQMVRVARSFFRLEELAEEMLCLIYSDNMPTPVLRICLPDSRLSPPKRKMTNPVPAVLCKTSR